MPDPAAAPGMDRARAAGCRVVLCGWYGAANLGDELILSVFVDWVREAGGDPTVVSVHPDFTSYAHGVAAAGYGDLAAVVEAMSEVDLVVLGGGGLFQNYDPFDEPSLHRFPARNVSQFAQFAFLAGELGLPVAVLGQGVGPLRHADAKSITAEVFERACVASVRDPESIALLRDIGVKRAIPCAPDPTWTCFGRFGAAQPAGAHFPALAGRPVMAMVLRDWPFDQGWEEDFATAFRAALPEPWGLLWLDFTRTPDASGLRRSGSEIAHRMIPRLPGTAHAVWEGMRVADAAALLAGSDACVAMRLHGALLAHLGGVPTVALEYDGKVRALDDELGVPAVQRMPLRDIPARLAGAVRAVTGADGHRPFRLDRSVASGLAGSALMHRDLLWKAMADSRGPRPSRQRRQGPSLLGEWLVHEPGATPRVIDALLRRGGAARTRS